MRTSIKITAALTALLLTSETPWYPPMAPAQTAPDEPVSEHIKKRALLMGFWLNGDSMVRPPSMGSIDVSEIVHIPDRPAISTIPPR